jgi:hypothetical protein
MDAIVWNLKKSDLARFLLFFCDSAIDYVMFFQSKIEALHNGPDGQEILTALGQNTRSGFKKNVSSVSIHSQR